MKPIGAPVLGEAEHLSLPESVDRQLRAAILNGVFRPGEVLRQEELARSLGVSRAPLREALSQLEAEGVVVLNPRRGYSVVSLDPNDIEEIFELRALIEGHVMLLSTKKRTQADIDKVFRILGSMEEASNSPAGITHWFDLNFEFHDALMAPAGRRRFEKTVYSVRSLVEPYIRVEISLTGDIIEANAEHRRLAAKFANGDAVQAAKLTREHILHTGARLLSGLQKGQDSR